MAETRQQSQQSNIGYKTVCNPDSQLAPAPQVTSTLFKERTRKIQRQCYASPFQQSTPNDFYTKTTTMMHLMNKLHAGNKQGSGEEIKSAEIPASLNQSLQPPPSEVESQSSNHPKSALDKKDESFSKLTLFEFAPQIMHNPFASPRRETAEENDKIDFPEFAGVRSPSGAAWKFDLVKLKDLEGMTQNTDDNIDLNAALIDSTEDFEYIAPGNEELDEAPAVFLDFLHDPPSPKLVSQFKAETQQMTQIIPLQEAKKLSDDFKTLQDEEMKSEASTLSLWNFSSELETCNKETEILMTFPYDRLQWSADLKELLSLIVPGTSPIFVVPKFEGILSGMTQSLSVTPRSPTYDEPPSPATTEDFSRREKIKAIDSKLEDVLKSLEKVMSAAGTSGKINVDLGTEYYNKANRLLNLASLPPAEFEKLLGELEKSNSQLVKDTQSRPNVILLIYAQKILLLGQEKYLIMTANARKMTRKA